MDATTGDNDGFLVPYGTSAGTLTAGSESIFSAADNFATSLNADGPAGASVLDSFAGTIVSTNPYASFEVSAVPLPAAFWLFGSGLLGLIGIAKRKKA